MRDKVRHRWFHPRILADFVFRWCDGFLTLRLWGLHLHQVGDKPDGEFNPSLNNVLSAIFSLSSAL